MSMGTKMNLYERKWKMPLWVLLLGSVFIIGLASILSREKISCLRTWEMEVVFETKVESGVEVYVANIDGTKGYFLTYNSKRNGRPTWSPDGCKIAFLSEMNQAEVPRLFNGDLYVIDVDGSDLRQLTYDFDIIISVRWSPDGRKIAFTAIREGDDSYEIYVTDVDGSNLHQITDSENANDILSDWSPDGKKILYTTYLEGDIEIYVINSDGTNIHQITNRESSQDDPQWSPDGKRILFSSDLDGDSDLYITDVQGADWLKLTENIHYDYSALWSPDGTRILFASKIDGVGYLYVIDLTNMAINRVTTMPLSGSDPLWLSNGIQIAFISDINGSDGIYLIDYDGNNLIKVAEKEHIYTFSWRP